MYTDPGTISMVVMALIGGVLAIPATIFMFKNKIWGWFNDRRNKNDRQ